MNPFSDVKVVDSWRRNAAPWAAAVQGGRIESRRLVTDQAILDAVLSRSPRSVLDVGCGEGWLARALAAKGVAVIGIDAVPELVERARMGGGGDFRVVSYEELADARLGIAFDAVVCNFSLLGQDSVDDVFEAVPSLLAPGGWFIVQTLHPVVADGDLPYQDGWRPGSWDGFGAEFIDPAPWYFRTVESWKALFPWGGLRLIETLEPIHPKTNRPASIIFVGEVAGGR